MKIYISVDMEGIVGTYNWKQEHSAVSRQSIFDCMYEQLKWVIEGIHSSELNSKIDEITIADSHSAGDNLNYNLSDLDSRIYLINGCPRKDYMMPTLNEQYDQIFLIGYHAGVGTLNGNMDHTYSGGTIHNLWINGKRMNETLINSMYAQTLGVPVTYIAGDKALYKELIEQKQMPWVEYTITKEATSRFSAKNYPKEKVKKDTIEKIKKVLKKSNKFNNKLEIKKTNTLKIELATTAMADCVELMPSIKRKDGRTVEFKSKDFKKLINSIMAIVLLATHGKY